MTSHEAECLTAALGLMAENIRLNTLALAEILEGTSNLHRHVGYLGQQISDLMQVQAEFYRAVVNEPSVRH